MDQFDSDDQRIAMIDRAMKQTVESGSSYIVIPTPWFLDWLCNVPRSWSDGLCFEDLNLTLEEDANGNVTLCTKPFGHEGECSRPS